MLTVHFKKLSPRYPDKFHIFVKEKHKIVVCLGIITLRHDKKLDIRINYNLLFKWCKKLNFKFNEFNLLLMFGQFLKND